jgi:hypothetical protein
MVERKRRVINMKEFTAQEARALMPAKKRISDSEMLMNHTYRRIKAAAMANQNYTDVNCNGYRASIINDVNEKLKENGFKTVYDCEYDRLVIMW